MISNPQEVESTAAAVANWIVYNKRPYIFPNENGSKVYLAVLTEEQMRMLDAFGSVRVPEMPEEPPQDVPAIAEEE